MMVIGVTGGIGSGKTTVTDLFAAKGIAVVDADVIARAVVEPGTPCLQALHEAFGKQVLNTDGSLNRTWLRTHIFSHQAAKQQVNAIMHPAIRRELLTQLKAATSAYVILSAPLLLENQLDKLCQRVLVVDIDETTQQQRTAQRDQISRTQVRAIMDAQLSRDARLAKANDVIDNNGPLEALDAQVNALHDKYLTLAAPFGKENSNALN